jgi:DNA repair exonuclease SbcCD ATPase subunit
MRYLPAGLSALLLIVIQAVFFPAYAQDMDSQEGVDREQYQQLTAQENALQQQIDNLANLKSQLDGLMGQVANMPTANYGQEADKYRQLELLLPSATRYSYELDQRQRQLADIQRQKAELRSRILQRRSVLPIWWPQ